MNRATRSRAAIGLLVTGAALAAIGFRWSPDRVEVAPRQTTFAGPERAAIDERERLPPSRVPGPATPDRTIPKHAPPVSHPFTPAHARIQRENALIGALNDALDLSDPVRLRELVKRYRAAEPEDVHRLQVGYELLADCLEFPGDGSRRAAEEYYRAERASTLRRFIRRICFEGERASLPQSTKPG
jgi:hypothetical protein